MSYKTSTSLILVALVILAGVWLFFSGNSSEEQIEHEPTPWANPQALQQSSGEENTIALPETYTNEMHHFSIRYPSGFTTGQFQDGDSTSVIIQNAAEGLGIQIYITPLDESVEVTPEQIQNDIAGITVKDPQQVLIGNSDNGLAFISENDSFGESREVWFVYNDTLFQVSTYAQLDPLLQAMMNTWEFNG